MTHQTRRPAGRPSRQSDCAGTASGTAAIIWVNWYFFVAERRSVAAEAKVAERSTEEAPRLERAVVRVGREERADLPGKTLTLFRQGGGTREHQAGHLSGSSSVP